MLRRILNFIVILIIIVAISGIFINLYNSGKKESNKFDTVKEKVKKDASSVKEKIKKHKDKLIEDNEDKNKSDSSENKQELDDKDVNSSEGSNNSNSSSSDTSASVSGNEIAVGSTGTKENILLTFAGGIVVLSGSGLLILKTNKFRA